MITGKFELNFIKQQIEKGGLKIKSVSNPTKVNPYHGINLEKGFQIRVGKVTEKFKLYQDDVYLADCHLEDMVQRVRRSL